jgi:hypothetical protein
VSVSGGSITGGTLGGIWIQGAHDVEIEDLDVVSSDPTSGSDTGVFLSYNQTVDPGVDPLSEVYIQPTVNVTGFDTEVGFTAPQGLDDGDDVAYCALETTPPAGCDAP